MGSFYYHVERWKFVVHAIVLFVVLIIFWAVASLAGDKSSASQAEDKLGGCCGVIFGVIIILVLGILWLIPVILGS